ncbi:hypothetical protein HMPREF0208_02376 [Citrobacter koseri]|nr:hypothetical protein HMPREF0208_02376 [Citrobacter koseri]
MIPTRRQGNNVLRRMAAYALSGLQGVFCRPGKRRATGHGVRSAT